MKVPAIPGELYLIGGLAVAAALWAAKQGGAQGAGQALGTAAVNAANGVITGTVTGIGETVGIPKTNDDQCTRDLAAGDLWKASFSCPAPRYLQALASGNYGGGNSGGATGTW